MDTEYGSNKAAYGLEFRSVNRTYFISYTGNPLQILMKYSYLMAESWIARLNSGITNADNFFDQSIFHHQKFENESVADADSGHTEILVPFPGN